MNLAKSHLGSRRAYFSESAFRRLLGLADALAISLATVISILATGHGGLQWATLAVPPLFLLLVKASGLYDRDARLLHKTTLDEVPALAGIATATVLLLYLSDGLLVAGGFERGEIALAWGLLVVLLVVLRAAARSLARRMTPTERCLFVGDAASAEAVGHKLATSRAVNAELVGWIPMEMRGDNGNERSALLARIDAAIEAAGVQRIVLGPGPANSEEFLDSVRRLRGNGLKVSVLPSLSRVVNSSVELDRLNGITLIGLRNFAITKSSRLVKRSFDVALSGMALVLLAPLMAVIAIAIRLDSRGGALYRQPRTGRHGEVFQVVKFRTMEDGADQRQHELLHLNEGDGVFKIADDPRITRAGRFLRPRHLDELPQLFNVLRGEMSLVGPRPLPVEEDRQIQGWHRRRLDLRPGMTGPWQILGSARIPVREMVKLDYQYVGDWSLWNDMRIMLLTLGHVARRGGQ